jgi:hypothetical protein
VNVELVEANQLSNHWIKSKIINYVRDRQNEDGGYCFAQGALESSSQDTYYGLGILSQLDTPFPNPEKTVRFLDENLTDSIYSMYYTAKAQLLLRGEINAELEKEINHLLASKKYFGSKNFFSDSSEFAITLMALELADLLKIQVNSIEIVDWLLTFENEDGGFGPHGHSNIDSTYHAIASLNFLRKSLRKVAETLKFVRSCEKPFGGFTVIPINLTAYMEYTYYGVMALDLLGEKSKYPTQTINWVLSCQTGTGGFARSDLGIATFKDTYYSIQIIHIIQRQLAMVMNSPKIEEGKADSAR